MTCESNMNLYEFITILIGLLLAFLPHVNFCLLVINHIFILINLLFCETFVYHRFIILHRVINLQSK